MSAGETQVITAIETEGRTVADMVAAYDVSRSWIYELLARYRDEGDTAYEPRSRRPRTSATAISDQTVQLIIKIRKQLTEAGLDAGPDTVSRTLARQSLVTPEPKKRPKSSYVRFEAEQPNQTWQSASSTPPPANSSAS